MHTYNSIEYPTKPKRQKNEKAESYTAATLIGVISAVLVWALTASAA